MSIAGRSFYKIHIVGIGDPKIGIESLPGRQILGKMPQVPFPKDACGVSRSPQQFRQNLLLRGNPPSAANGVDGVLSTADGNGIRQQSRATGRADRVNIEARQTHAVDSQLVEIMELLDHPWFVGVQFHPEYSSTVMNPHPLFIHFVEAILQLQEAETTEDIQSEKSQ